MTKLVRNQVSRSALWPLQTRQKGISHHLASLSNQACQPIHPAIQLQVVQPNQQFSADLGVGWEASSNDDVTQMWLGTGPQLDGLGHMGEAGEFWLCNQGKIFIITGLTKLDISGIPPMVGRGS